MNNDSRDAHLMSGAYVLHALDPEERAAVEAAMRGSEELRGEIAELSDTAVVLGLAVRAEQPPAALRNRVLAEVAVSPQLAPASRTEDRIASWRSGRAERAAQARWFRRPAVLAAAAAVAGVLFVGGLGVDRLVNPPATQASAFVKVSSASDAETAHARVAGGGAATVVSSARLGESAIVLAGVSIPTDGRVLQVWRLSGSTATSEGLYRPVDGTDYQVLRGSLKAGERYAVTVEPAGGSRQPTTTPIVSVTGA